MAALLAHTHHAYVLATRSPVPLTVSYLAGLIFHHAQKPAAMVKEKRREA